MPVCYCVAHEQAYLINVVWICYKFLNSLYRQHQVLPTLAQYPQSQCLVPHQQSTSQQPSPVQSVAATVSTANVSSEDAQVYTLLQLAQVLMKAASNLWVKLGLASNTMFIVEMGIIDSNRFDRANRIHVEFESSVWFQLQKSRHKV